MLDGAIDRDFRTQYIKIKVHLARETLNTNDVAHVLVGSNGLFQIFQVMVSFATTCSSANHRFFCFQALDRLYLLEQLVSTKCPYESMSAVAVNLVKGTVERVFVKLDKARAKNAERTRTGSGGSDGFFRTPGAVDVKAFEHNGNLGIIQYSGYRIIFNGLHDEMDMPIHEIKSNNGVVNFDIGMGSGDEGSGDDDDPEKAKDGRRKDKVVDLNQKMMKLEIMDELLERI
ncbi:hypothetical protein BGZ65_005087 [Modicella reniformis]|uniref:Uncharacterized protein n=1 Tax=Modicella reniformis TaxID=1440133 RepID=A0A9P6MGQ6_9FUNG|nr:hypothetical protein BGZ65_005087 [Modicella reniformis]